MARLATEPAPRSGICEMIDVQPEDRTDYYCGKPATHLHKPVRGRPDLDMHICSDCAAELLKDLDFVVEPLPAAGGSP